MIWTQFIYRVAVANTCQQAPPLHQNISNTSLLLFSILLFSFVSATLVAKNLQNCMIWTKCIYRAPLANRLHQNISNTSLLIFCILLFGVSCLFKRPFYDMDYRASVANRLTPEYFQHFSNSQMTIGLKQTFGGCKTHCSSSQSTKG